MPRKPVLAYAIGGTAAAVAAIVITASTVGLHPTSSEGAPNESTSTAAVAAAGANAVLTSYQDGDHGAYTLTTRYGEHEGREHDDDD
ncbi:MAG: hypothetical protein U0446_05345 [Dehalococcoidia bacterium]